MTDYNNALARRASLFGCAAALRQSLRGWGSGCVLACALLLGTSLAHAASQEPMVANTLDVSQRFAQPQQIFVSLGTESLLQGIWAAGFESTFSIELAPAVGYFFTDHFFARLGLEMQLDQLPKAAQDVGDIRTFAMAVAPGVGGAWQLHPRVTVAPTISVGLGRVWRSVRFSGYRSTVGIEASAPFVFNFIDHVSFFVAPSYKQLVVNRETFPDSARNATLGGRLGVSMGALAHW